MRTMHCSECGAQLLDEAKFCTKCGTHVPSEAQPPETMGPSTRQVDSALQRAPSRRWRQVLVGLALAGIFAGAGLSAWIALGGAGGNEEALTVGNTAPRVGAPSPTGLAATTTLGTAQATIASPIQTSTATPRVVVAEITAAGDTISLGHDVTLRIPAGAVSATTTVTITPASAAEPPPGSLSGGKPVGAAFSIDLGDQKLLKPAILEITFDPALLPEDTPEASPFLAYYDEVREQWVPAGGHIDRNHNTIAIETDHFSWWQAWSWWLDAFKAALYAGLQLDPFQALRAASSYQDCVDSSNVIIDDSSANNILNGCVEEDDPDRPEVRVINRKVFTVEIEPKGDNMTKAGFTVAWLGANGQHSFTADFSDLKGGDAIDVQGSYTSAALGIDIVAWALMAVPGGQFVPFDVVVELANTIGKDPIVMPVLELWERGEYEEAIKKLGDVFSDPDFANLLWEKLGDLELKGTLKLWEWAGPGFLIETLRVVKELLLPAVYGIVATDLISTANSPQGLTGTIAFVSNKPTPLTYTATPTTATTIVGAPITAANVGRLAPILELAAHEYELSRLALSPDGAMLATTDWVDADHPVKLWDVATGQELRTLAHQEAVLGLAFSPDGAILASATGADDATVRLWDVATGAELRSMTGQGYWISSVAFSPDGTILASGGHDGTVKLWEVATGRELRTMEHYYDAGPGAELFDSVDSVETVAFSPDGTILASGTGYDMVKLWDVATGRELRTFSDHSDDVTSVAFSPDGTMLASGSNDNSVKLREVATGRELRTLQTHADVSSVSFSADGTILVSVSIGAGGITAVGTATLWEVATGRELAVLERQGGNVFSAVFSGNGTVLALAETVWDLDNPNGIVELWGVQ
jgi:WD40 repeat protein